MEGWANRNLICDSCNEYAETLVPRFFIAHAECPTIRVAEAPAPADAIEFSNEVRSEGEQAERYFLGCFRCNEAVEVVHVEYGQPYRIKMKDLDEAQRFLLRHPTTASVMTGSEIDLERWRTEWECDCAAPRQCTRCKGSRSFWATRAERMGGDQVAAPDIRPLLDRMSEMFGKYYVDGPVEIEIRSASTPGPEQRRTREHRRSRRPPLPRVPARTEAITVDISVRKTVSSATLKRLFGELDTRNGEEERIWTGRWSEEAAFKYLLPWMLKLTPISSSWPTSLRLFYALERMRWRDWDPEERSATAHCLAATCQRTRGGGSALAVPLAQGNELKGATQVAAGLDGTIWVLHEHEGQVWRVDPSSGALELFVDADDILRDVGTADLLGIELAGIAGDASGNVYLSDAFTGRILNVNGSTRRIQVVAEGSVDGTDLGELCGLELTSEGHLYIADRQNDRIVRLDTKSGELTLAVDGLAWPERVVSGRGELWVLHRVDDYDRGLTVAFSASEGDSWRAYESDLEASVVDFAASQYLGVIRLQSHAGSNALWEAQWRAHGGKYCFHFEGYHPPSFDASKVTAIAATHLGVIVALEAETGRLWWIAPGRIFADPEAKPVLYE